MFAYLSQSVTAILTLAATARSTPVERRQGTVPCGSIPAPVVPGAQVVSITGVERLNVSGLNFCEVTVTFTHPGVNDSVVVGVGLPLNGWNGRFQAAGGGGYVAGYGESGIGVAISNGYSAGWTDGGNISDFNQNLYPNKILSSSGQIDLGLFTDFASRALHELAVVGKAVTTSYYGTAPHHSYWAGCSTGGRQGYMMAQKYPEDFNGILANAPAVFWTTLLMALHWPRLLLDLAKTYPPQCEFSYIQNASIAACDGLDGVIDGIISDPDNCPFDPTTLVGSQTTCDGSRVTITQTVADIVRGIHDGITAPSGLNLWPGYDWGTAYNGFANTTTMNGTTVGAPRLEPDQWISYFLKKDPSFDLSTLTLEQFIELLALSNIEYNGIIGTDNPDLSAFRDAGGKLLTWHGLADFLIMHNNTLIYRDQVERIMGGYTRVNDFYRLFFPPGVSHCGSGYGPVPTDPLAQLVSWVEHGQAPETLPAAFVNDNGVNVTRDVCLWPLVARYDGTGDPNLASSYTCASSFGPPAGSASGAPAASSSAAPAAACTCDCGA